MINVKALHRRTKLAAAIVVSLAAVCAFAATQAMAVEFGLERLAVSARNQDGTPDVQAGSHPYALTTTFVLNRAPCTLEGSERICAGGGDIKDSRLELPPGFVGDPNATPRCTYQEFSGDACNNQSVVGVATVYFVRPRKHANFGAEIGYFTLSQPVYNVMPPAGVAAEFGFDVAGAAKVLLQTGVRTGRDYGLTTVSPNIPQDIQIGAVKVTIWGVPASPAHDLIRGGCLAQDASSAESPLEAVGRGLREGEDELEGPITPYTEGGEEVPPVEEAYGNPVCPSYAPELPLLTNPTSCGVPRSATFGVDSWEEPGNFSGSRTRTVSLPPLTGCEKLDFSPTIGVTPDGSAGSTPTGLNVGLHVPQETALNPVGLTEADVKDTTVTLPAGVQISPGASDGLQACSTSQIGFMGFKELDPSVEPGVQTSQFTAEAPSCPNASKIANVRIKTPLLENELTGSVYLASPQNFAGLAENPFSSLVAMYLVAEEPVAGVRIKLAGKVVPNETTGQLTTTFENTPALPFSELKLEFFGTDRAPLTTPALCGTYNTEASFVPWSGTPAVTPASSFQISSGPQVQTASGPQTSPCADPLPFSPTLESGVTNINAGSYSDLTTTFSREDGQQALSGLTLHYPAGFSGLLSGVKLCGEAEANAGTCGAESQIGETIVSVGLGNDPFNVTGGKVYITGPYHGAPFGLSIVNPAKAGPFDLQEGRPVVVRAKIEVDPHTAALTITTDPPGSPHAIPTMIDGIPLQIKHVNVNVNRPDFTFNPTNCEKAEITGTIESSEGATSPVSDPFQVTNCAVLKFAPKFAVSTSAKTSRADGASLHVGLTYPDGPGQANIKQVKVELPKQLPSRLTTLQKACTAAQFNANPAGCPAASLIGHAKATTPLIPVPLEGPAYFVSNGSEAFPNLIVVLQGYGVTIDLVGDTYISKAGITSSTFKTVPDAPVGSFELTLPEGPYSALTTDGNLCTSKLAMPTEFIAQNGAVLHQSTKIAVTGCTKTKAKTKALTRAQKLTKALEACKKSGGKRVKCEASVRKRYGTTKKKGRKK